MKTVAYAELESIAGTELGVSPWLVIDQARVNAFAEATGDHQWIHVDVPRATKELGGPIAHGFLTLSLIPHLGATVPMADAKAYEGLVMGVNYGLDKVRFPSPVKVNSRVRAHRELMSAELVNPSTIQLKQKVTIEIEGETKPACVAETLSRLIYG
jgi:acyl dehydratase